MSKTTQEHLYIKDIHNDLVVLKDGSVAVVLKTSAVNFDLLSENEQLAIIESFAGLLNSLSFSIQIVIRSKRLDITNYLETLSRTEASQSNPLLKQMISSYKSFVSNTIKENEVLDKQFYIVILVSYLELGLISDIEKHFQKAATILIPRRDHIIRQLSRIGLKATQLDTEKLLKLYYDIYNEQPIETVAEEKVEPTVPATAPAVNRPVVNQPQVTIPRPNINPFPQPITAQPRPVVATGQPSQSNYAPNNHNVPYIVEELPDDYSSV